MSDKEENMYGVIEHDPVDGKTYYPPMTYAEVIEMFPWAAGLSIDNEQFAQVILLTTDPAEYTIRRIGA